MFRAALFATLAATPAVAQHWGGLECQVVRNYVEASRDYEVQVRTTIGMVTGELNANRGHLPMDARGRFDDYLNPLAWWRPATGADDSLIARLLDDRCDPTGVEAIPRSTTAP